MDGVYPEDEVDSAEYNIDLQLLLTDTADRQAVLTRIQEILQMAAAPNLAMCRRRRLQKEAILGTAFFTAHDSDSGT